MDSESEYTVIRGNVARLFSMWGKPYCSWSNNNLLLLIRYTNSLPLQKFSHTTLFLVKGRKYYCVINLFFIICLGDSCRWCTLLSQSQKQTKHTHMQTCSLVEKYTLSIILAASVLKSRKLTPWTFSPMVSGAGCQNFYQLRRSPKKTPLRSIRFCDTTTIFRSSQNVWQIPKICIVSALISMGNFGELLACLLASIRGYDHKLLQYLNNWRWNVRSPVKDIRWQPSNEKTITTSHAIISFVCCSRRINFRGEWLIFEPSDMTLFHWSLIVLVGTSTMVIEIDSQREF